MIGEIAGDDDAVGQRIEGHNSGECELQPGGGAPAQRPGGDVRVAELRDERRHAAMIQRNPPNTTERS
nr:hypothetical protein GCM10020092_010160 [Actinoplanes digitatis]